MTESDDRILADVMRRLIRDRGDVFVEGEDRWIELYGSLSLSADEATVVKRVASDA